jgi:hypothetical protein
VPVKDCLKESHNLGYDIYTRTLSLSHVLYKYIKRDICRGPRSYMKLKRLAIRYKRKGGGTFSR